jgi:lipopolysaccharide cholinephosphotransferase
VKYDYDSSSKVLDYDDGLSGITEKSVLGNPTPIEFEGCQLMGVEKLNDYLSKKIRRLHDNPPT